MKIAIVGEGPIALESTLFFLKQDCSVTLFVGDRSSKSYFDRYVGIDEVIETSIVGQEELEIEDKAFSLDDYQAKYFLPLMEKLNAAGIIRPCRVNRVTKAHLSTLEELPGRSRLADLFRVTFEMDAEKMVEEQIKLNEMAFNNISPSTLSSLKRSIEMAEDFDLVILAKESFEKNSPIGVGGNLCLNERVFNQEDLFFNRGFAEISKNIHSLAVFGDELGLSWGLMNIKDWLESSDNKKVHIISSKEGLKERLGRTNSSVVNTKIKKIVDELNSYNINEEKRLEAELKKWNELEDYVRVKYPRPQMIEPQINFLESTNVISIDQLDEQKKFFLTIEPTKSVEQYEEFLGVKTIGVDAILNMNPGKISSEIVEGLKVNYRDLTTDKIIFPEEPGFFNISKSNAKAENQRIEKNCELILDEIKKYFSKN